MTSILAANFDETRPEYVQMFNDSNKHLKEIYVLLHVNTSLDIPENPNLYLV